MPFYCWTSKQHFIDQVVCVDDHAYMIIKISKNDIEKLVDQSVITLDQSEKIWQQLSSAKSTEAQFNLTHFLYFFGGVICILAMSWFASEGWEQFGGAGLAIISLIYMLAFTKTGNSLWQREEFKIPAGLTYTIAVCMVPLLIYGIQRWTGFWIVKDAGNVTYKDYHELIRGSWMLMSVGTVLIGSVYLKYRPFPFLTMPIAVALFYITMDIVPFIHGVEYHSDLSDLRSLYSMFFGLLMIVLAYFFDKKEKLDYSFWLYLFGAAAFWGGLTSMDSDKELGKFIYFLINVGLLLLSLFLYRRIFMIFGSFGVLFYIGHLANKVFKDSLMFPFALTLLGLAVIFLGIKYQKNKERIDAKFSELLPTFLKSYRPQERK